MKTLKIFLFAFAIVLFSSFNVQSQSVSEKWINFEWTISDDYSPELGSLTGTSTMHVVFKLDKLGNINGVKINIHSINVTSSASDETFMVNLIQQESFITPDPDVILARAKLVIKGNMGTRIVCTQTYEINAITGEEVSLEHNHKQWLYHLKLW
jgi:hypothetical protein